MRVLSRKWLSLLVICVAWIAGCDSKDADRLARMGRRGANKLQIAGGDAHSQLSATASVAWARA